MADRSSPLPHYLSQSHRHQWKDASMTEQESDCSSSRAEESYTSSEYDSEDSSVITSEDLIKELGVWMNQIHLVKNPLLRAMSMPEMGSSRFAATEAPKTLEDGEDVHHHPLVLNRMRRCQSAVFQSPCLLSEEEKKAEDDSTVVKPEDCLTALFKKAGVDDAYAFAPKDADFLPITDDLVAAHSLELTDAARAEDLPFLQKYFAEGKKLQACNRYGESIVHIVCRRGSVPIFTFLTEEAKLSIVVQDDMKRTPMHDAAWTDQPNFVLVKLILQQAPQLLLSKDKRGFSPLSYVPRARWADWCDFLTSNEELILQAVG